MTDRTNAMRACPLKLMLIGCACAAMIVTAAAAQTDTPPAMTSQEALATLPDPEAYRLVIFDDGLSPQAVQDIGQMVISTIGEDHFFGAIAAYVPADKTRLSVRIRTKLHSLEAAERGAMQDCEDERGDEDSDCRIIGQIVPEEWDAATAPSLSHDAMYPFDQGAEQLEGPKYVARSRDTAAWAIWGGEGTRQSALDECNDAVEATGAEADCDIVIEDTP